MAKQIMRSKPVDAPKSPALGDQVLYKNATFRQCPEVPRLGIVTGLNHDGTVCLSVFSHAIFDAGDGAVRYFPAVAIVPRGEPPADRTVMQWCYYGTYDLNQATDDAEARAGGRPLPLVGGDNFAAGDDDE